MGDVNYHLCCGLGEYKKWATWNDTSITTNHILICQASWIQCGLRDNNTTDMDTLIFHNICNMNERKAEPWQQYT
jgi:hypothetical protein